MTTTESSSSYDQLESMSVRDLLTNINKEDQTVPKAIEKVIPRIEMLVNAIVDKMMPSPLPLRFFLFLAIDLS